MFAGTGRRGRTGPMRSRSRTTLEFLGEARRPLFLLGRLGRDEQDWDRRVALAERYGALVISDLKNGAVFPTRHPLHPNPPGIFLPAASAELIGAADLIVSLGLGRPGRDHLRGGQPRSSGLGADHLLHDGLRAAQRLVQGFFRT